MTPQDAQQCAEYRSRHDPYCEAGSSISPGLGPCQCEARGIWLEETLAMIEPAETSEATDG